MLMKAFIISQFSYCLLVWMFHSRNTENRVNKVHERALRLVYHDSFDDSYDDRLRFDELVIIDKSVSTHRNSRPEVFYKKGVLRIFAKFTGKHLCQGLVFNKAAGLRPAISLEKSLWHRCFPVNFAKFVRIPFLKEHLRWLLLHSSNLQFLIKFLK